MKNFLAIGDLVINPDQLAYAAWDDDSEQPKLRLVFAPGASLSSRNELRLEGEEAKAALRWLRLNSSFANGTAASPLHGGALTSTVRPHLRERERDRCVLEGATR